MNIWSTRHIQLQIMALCYTLDSRHDASKALMWTLTSMILWIVLLPCNWPTGSFYECRVYTAISFLRYPTDSAAFKLQIRFRCHLNGWPGSSGTNLTGVNILYIHLQQAKLKNKRFLFFEMYFLFGQIVKISGSQGSESGVRWDVMPLVLSGFKGNSVAVWQRCGLILKQKKRHSEPFWPGYVVAG